VIRCSKCGEQNPDRAQFCLACGTALARARQPEEERKVVSVLFVDLVGFTDRSDRADPEDVRATLHPYHARVKQEIERFGGTVEKFVGDAVMAAFGAPVTHEDDAERAVRSGLSILATIEEMNRADPRLELAVRAAVNTGEAVVSLAARPEAGEGIATGDVVNTASRLQQVAPIGGIVVGEITFRATKSAIAYEELGPVSVKGKAEPVRIYRVTGVRSELEAGAEPPPATPFVGREDELALLRQTYGRTVREASVQLVTVTGEPGIGKTRLLSEFRAYLEEQPEAAVWRQGRCLPYGEGITFWALGEIVKGQTGILESDSPERAAAKLEAAVERAIADSSERDWFEARLAPLVGAQAAEATGAAERAESFTAWRRFLEAIAAERPLVLVFDDLHWADDALLEFLEHLVDWSSGVPLLLVCVARPELYERRSGWGGGKRNSTTIALSPLTGDETARLISALLSQAVLPADTQTLLLERAGGNPLYAEEFVRMLSDRGILIRRGRRLEIASEPEIPVPESVHALIGARLDTLTPDRKGLLFDAAVVGKVFWAGAVASIGGLDERTVQQGLHELVRKELVRPARTSSVEGQDEFSFWHLLVRDVAYQQIPRAARARKHWSAAKWIERIAEDRVADHAEILAHHYADALELARAAGALDEAREFEGPTRRFLIMAGDRAFALDVGRAESYYRLALELLPPGHPERTKVLVKAAEAAFFAGRFPDAERRYEEAIAELQAQGNVLGVGEAMVSLSFLHGFRGETGRARMLLDEVIELLEQEEPGAELARAYAQIAREHMLSGRWDECLEWSQKALDLAERLAVDDVTVMVRQFRGVSRCEHGDSGGLDDLRQALERSLELGLGQETVRAHINLGGQLWFMEGPAGGLEVHRAGIAFGERRGLMGPVMWAKGESLWMLFDLGEWEELIRLADELIAWEEHHGESYFGVMALSYKARVLVQRGAVQQAAALTEKFVHRARKIEDPQILAPALVIGAAIEQARADQSAALDLVEEFRTATSEHPTYRADHLADAVRICCAAKRDEEARRLFAGLKVAMARQRYALLTATAVLAEAEGHLEDAADHYSEAVERWRDYRFVLEQALALLGLGRCRVALGRADASGALAAARELFARLGAQPLLAETDGLLIEAVAARSS
jgi:class 3 adenylate cyclase/tetratricopeptide (TPR) repeat protein